MNLSTARLLAILSVILFGVALVLALATNGQARTVADFTMGGFLSLAAAHALG